MESLRRLFVGQLSSLYAADHVLLNSLRQIAAKAASAELQSTLESHLRVVEQHVSRLEMAFRELNEQPIHKRCRIMETLIDDALRISETQSTSEDKDAALIQATKRIEYFEMSAYDTACTMAGLLKLPNIASLLQQSLDDERGLDVKLTILAADTYQASGFLKTWAAST